MRVVVIGAGIAGLTTAVALGRQGVRCAVVERSPMLPGTGGGIQLSPNATAVLRDLGLGRGLAAGAFRPVTRDLRRWRDGGLIGRVELGRAEQRYGAPYYTLRRGALCRELYEATVRIHGPGAVRLGRVCTGIGEVPGAAVVELDDGRRLRADAVVGADGLGSVVRRLLSADPPRFSGHVAYRAVLTGVRSPDRVVVWLGPGRHCVAYPVRGGVNLVATMPAAEPPAPARGVPGHEMLAGYVNWHPAVRELLAAAGTFDRHPLYDRDPLPSWHRGRVVLAGDAAHPMLPFLAQGACQAIEDAAALARHIHRADAFERYEAERQVRTYRVVAAARAAAIPHHLRDGDGQRHRDARLAGAGLAGFDWLYGRADRAAA
jgi:salicylate hydroxylase